MPPARRPRRPRLAARCDPRQEYLKTMEGPITHGRAKSIRGSRGRGAAAAIGDHDAPKPQSIQWQADHIRTDELVEFLLTHPSNWPVLFFSNPKSPIDPSHGDPPRSGKDKVEICVVIAKAVFEYDHKYSDAYAEAPN